MKTKGFFAKSVSALLGLSMLFFVGCGQKGGHVHAFNQKVESETYLKTTASCTEKTEYYYSCSCGERGQETFFVGDYFHTYDQAVAISKYLKSAQTCTEKAQYYYSCVCGAVGEDSFPVGSVGRHDYSVQNVGEEYLATEATCLAQATYYLSCSMCGKSGKPNANTFAAGELGDHKYDQERVTAQYLATEATEEVAATYFYSCVCGLKGSDTFSYGVPIRDLTSEEQKAYTPTSLTMVLYDAAESIYGFTYNTQNEPLRPVIQFEKGTVLTQNAQEVGVESTKHTALDVTDTTVTYYVSKGVIDLEPSTTYTYRIYDKYAKVGTEAVTFQTKDTKETTFAFSHFSDTQSWSGVKGAYMAQILDHVKDSSDFILHTGDVVTNSKYEYEWSWMLNDNFTYLSKMPMMVAAGNHDTVYNSNAYDLFKHFNNNLPTQDSTARGYYYSFTYGNAKFIVLNTNENGGGALDTEQYDWLIDELENNDSTWTFVAMHAPLYSCGRSGDGVGADFLRKQLQGVFADYGVDIVFQGHDHLVQRTNPISNSGYVRTETWETEGDVEYSVDPKGVIYVMSGAAGPDVGRTIKTEDEKTFKYVEQSKARSWADISIDGDTLTFEAKYHDGTSVNTYHKWGIKKNQAS